MSPVGRKRGNEKEELFTFRMVVLGEVVFDEITMILGMGFFLVDFLEDAIDRRIFPRKESLEIAADLLDLFIGEGNLVVGEEIQLVWNFAVAELVEEVELFGLDPVLGPSGQDPDTFAD